MSETPKGYRPHVRSDLKEVLKDVLNFGPEQPALEANVSSRLRELVKKLQDLNRRIDALSSRM